MNLLTAEIEINEYDNLDTPKYNVQSITPDLN